MCVCVCVYICIYKICMYLWVYMECITDTRASLCPTVTGIPNKSISPSYVNIFFIFVCVRAGVMNMPWKEEMTYIVDTGAGLGEVMHGVPIRGQGLGTTRPDGMRG